MDKSEIRVRSKIRNDNFTIPAWQKPGQTLLKSSTCQWSITVLNSTEVFDKNKRKKEKKKTGQIILFLTVDSYPIEQLILF